MSDTPSNDPRRQGPLAINWIRGGSIGQFFIDGKLWGAVEWSDKRKAWCIEDAEGRCLSHHSHIHAQDADKAGAVALAEAMIRDGRMPTPEAATKARNDRLAHNRERRAKQPAEIKRRAAREESSRLWRAQWDAEREEQITEDNDPLWSVIADVIDFTDPEIWKSNAFARLRDRLIPHVEWAIAQLENNRFAHDREQKLSRARDLLATISAAGPQRK
jgi:hypothetical protein